MHLRTLAQLVRLPAVFTLIADVLAGYWFVLPELQPVPLFSLLLTSSVLLYMAGMVLNDVFDVEQDTRERPHRPIPSGRVSYATAQRLGFAMLALGWGAGMAAGLLETGPRGMALTSLLAVAVVAYDWRLKRTWLGPLAMGLCRCLNLLMIMCASPAPLGTANYLLAGGVGLYVTGVTWYARREAAVSPQASLAAGMGVMLAGVATLYSLRWFLPENNLVAPLVAEPDRWHVLWAIYAAWILFRCGGAVLDPTPAKVGFGVRHALMSLILFDAAITWAQRDVGPALVIFALILPALLVSRWFSAT
jgi:4-hydroxybenzoate polyprenyltransferase